MEFEKITIIDLDTLEPPGHISTLLKAGIYQLTSKALRKELRKKS